jgi:hypothetical protein
LYVDFYRRIVRFHTPLWLLGKTQR